MGSCISTGPYAVVRHPMYSGALLMLLGTPPALGSWWGLLMWIPMVIIIAWRARAEEKYRLNLNAAESRLVPRRGCPPRQPSLLS